MNFEKNNFEQKGLKIDKERVLTYSQLSCPLDCSYCFVDDLNFNQQKNVSYLSQEQYDLLEKLPENIETIMLGCDTEFFQSSSNSLHTLEKMALLKRNISVITKLHLKEDFINEIKNISDQISNNGNIFVFSVSLPCGAESAKRWERGAPSPEKRIETLSIAKNAGLKTMTAIRPLLPSVPDNELEEIVAKTKDQCLGYYSGPLYLKTLDILSEDEKKQYKIEQIQPHWMPEGNIFYKVEKEGQMDYLRQVIENNNKPFFEGAAEGIKFIKENL